MSEPSGLILADAVPERIPNTPMDILRRALLWTLLCGISATPSFIWGSMSFNQAAMVVGVILFIACYTFTTSTQSFLRLREKPFVRRTLYIGYITRVCLSIAFPVGMAADLFPGLLSIYLVNFVLPGNEKEFLSTLLITIVQGTILNLIIFIYMLGIWGIQLAFCKLPTDQQRGFPVELTPPRDTPP